MDLDDARRWGERALTLAMTLGEIEIQSHALNNTGVAMVLDGAAEDGFARLRRSLDLALASGFEEHAARAYTNLGSVAADRRMYEPALRELEAGIRYCEEHDLDSWTLYMSAWTSVVLGETGRFAEASARARAVLDHPGVSPVSAIPAAAEAGRIEARIGGDPAPLLTLAASLASGTGELQRIGPAACASAEAAWLAGDVDSIAALSESAWERATAARDSWMVGELAWWRMLAGIEPDEDAREAAAEPFALMLGREFTAAADAWEQRGSPVWAAYARGRSADAGAAERAVQTLEGLGAAAAVEAVMRTRREAELPLPRRPRDATRAHPGSLTAREHEILVLLAEGLATAQIAEHLVISPRTVEHHVSAVLRKLGEPTRARAVAAAHAGGLLER